MLVLARYIVVTVLDNNKWLEFPWGNPLVVYASREQCEKAILTTKPIPGTHTDFACQQIELQVELLHQWLKEDKP
jgi:hypothetical protein